MANMSSGDSVTSAAELRRQKILQNQQRRLEMLMGIKNAEAEIKDGEILSSSLPEVNPNRHIDSFIDEIQTNTTTPPPSKLPRAIFPQSNEAIIGDKCDKPEDLKKNLTALPFLKFNGYSNAEIVILVVLALFSTLVFQLGHADIIYKVY